MPILKSKKASTDEFRTILAQHIEKKDSAGNPLIKQFSEKGFKNAPRYYDKSKRAHKNGGWKQIVEKKDLSPAAKKAAQEAEEAAEAARLKAIKDAEDAAIAAAANQVDPKANK